MERFSYIHQAEVKVRRPVAVTRLLHTGLWRTRCLRVVRGSSGPVVLVGGPQWGTHHLLAALADEGPPFAWIELGPEDHDDAVSCGTKLAEALRRALGRWVLSRGASYTYGIPLLRSHLRFIGPLAVAASCAENNLEFAHHLLSLHEDGCRVLLAFTSFPEDCSLPEEATVIGPEVLRLRRKEALEAAGRRLDPAEVEALLQETGGAYESFFMHLHARLGLLPPMRPGPEGPRLPPGCGPEPDQTAMLELFLGSRRFLDAVELAACHFPKHVPEVLRAAGHVYQERGLYRRLWRLLSTLPWEVKRNEVVLFWRFAAAVRLGYESEVRPEVEAHLSRHEAPEIRALYSGTLAPIDRALEEAERAYRAVRSPHTAYQYGMRLQLADSQRAVEVLYESVHLAEREGHAYEVIRNAQGLAVALAAVGRYRDAESWLWWALERFEHEELGDFQRRMAIVNDWAYMRILTGRTASVGPLLEEGEMHLAEAYPNLAYLYQSTLGDYHLSRGDAEQALAYYRINWERASRRDIPSAACSLVRALLDLGEVEEALEAGERAYRLCRDEFRLYRNAACLAYGMALAAREPEAGVSLLEVAYEGYRNPLLAYKLAQAALHLARARFRLGDRQGAKQVLEGAQVGLEELAESGIRLLAGPPEEFHGVLSLLDTSPAPIELRLLGRCEVRVGGRFADLPRRWAEILALLALHPEGLRCDELAKRIYGVHAFGDIRAWKNALKVAISKLREVVPIASRPYRIALPFRADFLEVERLLAERRVANAVSLYAGPLLPNSEVREIEELRWGLESRLQQAVLSARDPEVVLSLAEQLGDDLTLWEAALETLPESDPRRLIVETRVKRVRRTG